MMRMNKGWLCLSLALASGGALADDGNCAAIRTAFAKDARGPAIHYAMASCAAIAKDVEQAFAFLASAAARGLHEKTNIEADPDFNILHADPRWRPAVARFAQLRSSYLASINAELRAIYQADQDDRRDGPAIDWKLVGPRDAARMKRVRELADAGALKHSDDFLHAAFVFQHGEKPEHFLQAQRWSLRAVELDQYNRSARWLACAAEDRYLQSTGKAQIWGTQFGPQGVAQPFDRSARTDAERRAMGVPTLAEMDAMMAAMKAGRTTLP